MMSQKTTIIGVFADRERAEHAIRELRLDGFSDDRIGLAMRHIPLDVAVDDSDDVGSAAGPGAVAGALTGLGLGALAGLGVLAGVLPIVGPAIAGGTLGVLLSNAAAGAGIASLVGALVGAGIPEDEARYYDEEFQAGRAIVTVRADIRAAEASAILKAHGAYDMQTRPGSAGIGVGMPDMDNDSISPHDHATFAPSPSYGPFDASSSGDPHIR